MSENRRTPVQPGARPAQPRPAGTRPQSTAARPQTGYAQRPPQQRPAQSGQRPPQSGQRPPVRRKKKRRATGRFYALIAVLVVLIVGLCVLIPRLGGNDAPQYADNAETPAPQTVQQQTAQEQTGEAQQAAAPTYNITTLNTSNLAVNEKLNGTWRSILLIGTDARLWDDMKHTDTMIIVCYNTTNGSIRMISVMRDAFVTIPEKENAVRINTVSTYAGMEGLIKVLNQNLGLNITEYALVDFAGFRNVIDILGGIDVDITEIEMEYINSSLKEQVNLLIAKGGRDSAIAANTLTTYGPDTHLSGLQALAYARIRKSDSDYKRTERQRTVIMEAAEKAINTVNVVQMSQIASTMLQHVETNMQLSSILQLGMQVIQHGLGDMEET
ncbi:MAG: LCP family protein, partial [Clostridia bacterium]|nr:LCP family protein [Clostridia bacterium]